MSGAQPSSRSDSAACAAHPEAGFPGRLPSCPHTDCIRERVTDDFFAARMSQLTLRQSLGKRLSNGATIHTVPELNGVNGKVGS
jgi:hypothetical protein